LGLGKNYRLFFYLFDWHNTGDYSKKAVDDKGSGIPLKSDTGQGGNRHGGITIDGNPSDWYLSPLPSSDNTWGVGNGEWLWSDKNSDVRTDGEDPDSNYEMLGMAICADNDNIYFLLAFEDITDAGLPYVAIGIDTDRIYGSGQWWFPDYANTGVSTGTQEDSGPGSGRTGPANWEKMIVVNLQKTGYYDKDWTWNPRGESYINTTTDMIEISMPLSNLEITLPTILRVSAIICMHDGAGGVKEIGGATVSNALDALTKREVFNTWDDVQTDQDVDYYCDVRLNQHGDAIWPVVINEFYQSSDYREEFVELYNFGDQPIDISGWFIGDEETQGSSMEANCYFPEGSFIQPDGFLVIAAAAATFQDQFGYTPDFEFANGEDDSNVPNLIIYPGSNNNFNLDNFGDEIFLPMQDHNAYVDWIGYNNHGRPDNADALIGPPLSCPDGTFAGRKNTPVSDVDQMQVDFLIEPAPTLGVQTPEFGIIIPLVGTLILGFLAKRRLLLKSKK
ncbi:MAG: lamin tail domain-containing protein, partial [Thermoplasmata archaeon]